MVWHLQSDEPESELCDHQRRYVGVLLDILGTIYFVSAMTYEVVWVTGLLCQSWQTGSSTIVIGNTFC